MPTLGRPLGSSAAVAVAEPSQVGQVRWMVAAVRRSLRLGETDAGRAGIVVTKAATDVLKRGRGGEVVVSPLGGGEAAGI
jgi:hypothetical protein